MVPYSEFFWFIFSHIGTECRPEKLQKPLFKAKSSFLNIFWSFSPLNCSKQTKKMDWSFCKLQIDVHHCMCINENNWGNSRCMTLLQRHFFSFFYSSFHQTFSSKMTSIWFWGSIFWKCDNFLVRWHCSNSQPLTWPVNKSSPSVVANHLLSSRGKAATFFQGFFEILSFYSLWKSLTNVTVQLCVSHSP